MGHKSIPQLKRFSGEITTQHCSFTLHTEENTLKQMMHTGLYRWLGVLLGFYELTIYLCFRFRQGSF